MCLCLCVCVHELYSKLAVQTPQGAQQVCVNLPVHLGWVAPIATGQHCTEGAGMLPLTAYLGGMGSRLATSRTKLLEDP